MKLTRNEVLEAELLREIDASMYDGDRTQPSVSGMIYCLTKTYYKNEMAVDGFNQNTKEQTMLFITGLGLERVLLSGRQIAEKGTTEGIQWHVDHVEIDGTNFMEIKSTRISTNKISKWDDLSEGWKRQILAYFYSKGIVEGDLAILHLMGGYSPPFPELVCWHMEATQVEVDANWQWILNRADTYKQFVDRQEVPTAFKYNMDWECKTCSFKGLCSARSVLSNMGAKTI